MKRFLLAALCLTTPVTAQTFDTQKDRVSFLDNGTIKLGVNLDLGGAITHLSTTKGENLINSHDWGRQIQMSFYSGPVPFAPGGKQPHKSWAFLGWNPIQSGDVAGHRSRILEHKNDGRTIYVKCIPMQWPLDNEPGECTFESWIELDKNTARVRSRLVNARSDKTQYTGRSQELPAVYTNGPYWRLMTYRGDKPFTDDALSQIPAKMPWTGWHATENWAALVNDNDWGLGIWTPNAAQYLGGFAGTPGKGGPADAPTGYIAPLRDEILDHNIVYDYSYTLIVGDLKTIRGFVYQNATRPAPPNYRFARERQGWIYRNAKDSGWPIQNELVITPEGDDPQIEGPLSFWRAEDAPKLFIEGAWKTAQSTAELFFWQHGDGNKWGSVRFEIVPDGKYRVYEVDLSQSPAYKGGIKRLRLDPIFKGQTGDEIRLRLIGFAKPTE
jgi:hypothetical protein